MERRGWIVLMAAALALVLFGAITWLNDDGGGAASSEGDASGSGGVASHAGGLNGEGGGATGEAGGAAVDQNGLPVYGDAGVPPRVAVRPQPADAPRLRADVEAERSAGWRLGATRRRIEVLSSRVSEMQQRMAEFERAGRTDLAERQQQVLDRFNERLTELRGSEGELAERAAAEGSTADEAVGYGEAESNRRVVSAGTPGANGPGGATVRTRP